MSLTGREGVVSYEGTGEMNALIVAKSIAGLSAPIHRPNRPSLDIPAHRSPPAMSRSVDPADRNRAVMRIPANDCSDKSSGRSVSPISSFLGRQQAFRSGFVDRGSKEMMTKCRHDLTQRHSCLADSGA